MLRCRVNAIHPSARRAGGVKRYAVVVRAAVVLMLAAGCGPSSLSPSQNLWCDLGNTEGTMSATIDGTAWSATRVVSPDLNPNNSYIEINASDCVHFLSLWINGLNGPGTYSVNSNSTMFESDPFLPAGPAWAAATSGSGAVTLTTLTVASGLISAISGTFNLALPPFGGGATGTKVIANGVFNLKF
jgi:hypothetical protein